jgi:hypothetical protein
VPVILGKLTKAPLILADSIFSSLGLDKNLTGERPLGNLRQTQRQTQRQDLLQDDRRDGSRDGSRFAIRFDTLFVSLSVSFRYSIRFAIRYETHNCLIIQQLRLA